MKTIYLVRGATGEWDDRKKWIVRAFVTRYVACRYSDLLVDILRTHNAWSPDVDDNGVSYEVRQETETALKDLDPHAVIDYTGASYYVDEVTLHD